MTSKLSRLDKWRKSHVSSVTESQRQEIKQYSPEEFKAHMEEFYAEIDTILAQMKKNNEGL